MGEEGRGAGDVLRHLRLRTPHQEGLQAGAVLLQSRRGEKAEVHLDTEGVVENVAQSEGQKVVIASSPVSLGRSHLITYNPVASSL